MSSNKLFEAQVESFLKTLNEQDPPLLPASTGTASPPATVGTPQTGAGQQPQQPPPPLPQQGQSAQQPSQDDTPSPTNIRFLSTPDLFTSKPPSDSADWKQERKKYYYPLSSGKVGQEIVKHLNKSGFIATGPNGAARYSEYQFRIVLRGDFHFDATIEAEINPDNTVDVNFSKISTATPYSASPVEFTGGDDTLGGKNVENISFKMPTKEILDWAKASKKGEEDQVGGDEEGDEEEGAEEEPASSVDDFVGQFFENKSNWRSALLEIELDKQPEASKKGAEDVLKKPFKIWFKKEISSKNDPETISYHMEDPDKKQAIKEAFAEWALTQGPAIDRKMLFKWLGKSIPMPAPGEDVGKIDLSKPSGSKKKPKSKATEKVTNSAEAKRYIKSQIDGDMEEETEKMAFRLYQEVARGLPEDHDLLTDVNNIKKMIAAAKNAVEDGLSIDNVLPELFKSFYKNETIDLHGYLKNLLLTERTRPSKAKGSFPKSPRSGAALERDLGGRIIKAVNDNIMQNWFGQNRVAAKTRARFFEGCLYEFLAVSSANFKPRKRKVAEKRDDGSILLQFDGEIVTESEIWIDARIGEKGTLGSWTFRVHDKPNAPFLTKGFTVAGKISSVATRGSENQQEVSPKQGQGETQ